MSDGLRLLAAFGACALLLQLTVPLAIFVARRTGFLDAPAGYKAHARATPYLGGAAVLLAALPMAVLVDRSVVGDYWPLLCGTVALAVVGTVDDRVNLSPLLRVAIEVLAAYLLWRQGDGWSLTGSDAGDFLLTAFWVVGVVNAFNLMDNLDGAATSVSIAAAASIGALALIGDTLALATIAVALCGALVGFLRFNLARPSRIFLGDGGSMGIGFLIAGALMTAPMGELRGWTAFVAAALIVSLPAFDTTLVVISRRRRGAPVLSGSTDHTTHRLLAVLKTPRAVAVALAGVQLCFGALAIEATQLGEGALIAVACAALVAASGGLAIAESPEWAPLSEER